MQLAACAHRDMLYGGGYQSVATRHQMDEQQETSALDTGAALLAAETGRAMHEGRSDDSINWTQAVGHIMTGNATDAAFHLPVVATTGDDADGLAVLSAAGSRVACRGATIAAIKETIGHGKVDETKVVSLATVGAACGAAIVMPVLRDELDYSSVRMTKRARERSRTKEIGGILKRLQSLLGATAVDVSKSGTLARTICHIEQLVVQRRQAQRHAASGPGVWSVVPGE